MDPVAQLERIKLLVCDVDGVLTDGSIIYCSGTLELKAFNIKDGLATKLAVGGGLPIIWVTGRRSEAVTRRADELGVQVCQGAKDKDEALRAIAEKRGLLLDEIAYIGDDLNDLPALHIVGLPVAVADAAPEVQEIAHYVTRARGGQGAVREVIEYILRCQDRWEAAMEIYLNSLHTVKVPH